MQRTRKTLWTIVTAFGLVCCGLGGPAEAQAPGAGDWTFRGVLYGWFPSIDGQTSHSPPASGASVNVDVGDYLDNLRFVFFGALEARRGRYGAFTDYIYLDFDAERGGSRDLTLSGPGGQIAIPAGAVADVNVRLRGWSWTLAGTYTIVERPSYEAQLLGGLRYLKVDNTIDWRFQGNVGSLPPVALSGSSTEKPDVWDAIIGAKGRMGLGTGPWYVPYYFDIGTGQSDLTWQAMVGIGYSFTWGEVFAAYRRLDYEFDQADGLQDLSFSGPGIGVAFRW
jgi:hypothetical protein